MDEDKKQNSGNKNTISNSSINAGGNVHIGDIINIHQQTPAASDGQGTPIPVVPETIQRLRELIGKGKIKDVLEQLLTLTAGDADQQNTAILLSQRWNTLQREQRLGVISRSEASVSSNQITFGILDLLGEL